MPEVSGPRLKEGVSILSRGSCGDGSVGPRPPLVEGLLLPALTGVVPDSVRLLSDVSGVPGPRPDTFELVRSRPVDGKDMLDSVVPSPSGELLKLPLLRLNSGG